MMVAVSDFVGKFEVAKNSFSTAKLNGYIDRYEKSYLIKLFGLDLYNLWFADPGIAPYGSLTFPFTIQTDCGMIYESRGIKSMLLGFIYYLYVRDIQTSNTIVGSVSKKGENSTTSDSAHSFIWQRYNESVETFNSIQAFICENRSDYPAFKGIRLSLDNPYF